MGGDVMKTFYENYFKPQNVTPDSRIFSPEHIILSSLGIFFIICIIHVQMKRCDVNYSKKILKCSAVIMMILEIFRISWSTFYYGFSLKNIRFDWCNQISLVLPFIVLAGKQGLYPYIDILSFMGGAGVLIYPAWVFYDYAGIHIMSVQSMISHTLMIIIPISISFVSGHWESEKNIRKPLKGFVCMVLVAYIMSRALNVNYLIMLRADGIPLLRNFSFPWYWTVAIPCLVLSVNLVKLMFCKLSRIIDKKRAAKLEFDGSHYKDEEVESII